MTAAGKPEGASSVGRAAGKSLSAVLSAGQVAVVRPTLPPPERNEVLRYAGAAAGDAQAEALLREVLPVAEPVLSVQAAVACLPLSFSPEGVSVGGLFCHSRDLAAALSGCGTALLLAVTLGVETDRLLYREGRLSPARALLLDALANERVEAAVDSLLATLFRECGICTAPRFSPGYGDLPLSLQEALLLRLDAPRRIGLTLTEGGMMSPTKSVTALAGIL